MFAWKTTQHNEQMLKLTDSNVNVELKDLNSNSSAGAADQFNTNNFFNSSAGEQWNYKDDKTPPQRLLILLLHLFQQVSVRALLCHSLESHSDLSASFT